MLDTFIRNLLMTIFLDFDGTVVEHQYPLIGPCNDGCFEVINKLHKAGHYILINSLRAEFDLKLLNEEVEFVNQSLTELNNNSHKYFLHYTDHKYDPAKWNWELHFSSGRIFIEDVCEGIPLKSGIYFKRNMVDWAKLNTEFEAHGLYK